MEQKGIFTKDTVGNGVFIFTDSKEFVSPDFWKLYKESERACCVAIVLNGMALFVAPNDYKDRKVCLLHFGSVSPKKIESINEALEDVDGLGNTERLSEAGSQVATDILSMDLAGLRWHIPTLRELQICYDNNVMLYVSLYVSGLVTLKDDLYLSSTYYDYCNFVLDWNDAYKCSIYACFDGLIRPVSAVSLSEIL